MLGYPPETWVFFVLAALVVGITKTGIPGIGILAVVLLAAGMENAKESVGFLLPLLIMGDVFAVAYYRRHAQWRHLVRLLPAALVGIGIGFFLMDAVTPELLRPVIGGIALLLLGLDFWWRLGNAERTLPAHWAVAAPVGVAAGVTTMLANAAGPLIVIYFLAMRFEKRRFIGTAAWYFLLLNTVKVPLFLAQDPPLITGASFRANLALLPAVLGGAVAGVFVLTRLPQRWFVVVVKVLTLAAAVKLIFS
jgi:hypothetical protein